MTFVEAFVCLLCGDEVEGRLDGVLVHCEIMPEGMSCAHTTILL